MVIAQVAFPAHQNRKIAASGSDWMLGTQHISVSLNYHKAHVTSATFRASPHGDFLQVLANAQESDV